MEREQAKELIRAAFRARTFAYTPYSHFKVGAALLAKDGRVFTGCNIENAGYTPTNCAERTALFKAVSEGVTEFSAIAIVGSLEGKTNTLITSPCGVCRQALFEFTGPALEVLLAKSETDYIETTLGDLLPYGFGPNNLESTPKEKEIWPPMSFPATNFKKKIFSLLSLLLALALAASLCSCGGQESSSVTPDDPAMMDDSVYTLTAAQVETPLDGDGALIALAAGSDGIETGTGAAVWRGVQNFCQNFNFTAQAFVAQEQGTDAAAEALRSAAESGAVLVQERRAVQLLGFRPGGRAVSHPGQLPHRQLSLPG